MSTQYRQIDHYTEAKDQCLYGRRLLYGNPPDAVEAAKWFTKAAEQGYADAQSSLASLYSYGKGVPQDDSLAALWTRKAADQGERNSQRALGFLYTEGRGVPQDYGKALQWFKKSADQGDSYAQRILAAMVDKNGVQQSFVQILNAANQGAMNSQRSLGDFYSCGKGIPRAIEQAAEWFCKAANQGDAYSQRLLGEIFRDGKGVPQDSKQADIWFRKAADQGDASAQKDAALLYSDDKPQSVVGGTPLLQNEALLREYLNDKNHQFNKYSLGQLCDALATILYERGLYAEAADYYFKAYDNGYYKGKIGSIGLANLASMRASGILAAHSPNSKSLQRIYELEANQGAHITRANNAALKVAVATFVGYHIWIYATHTTGALNDASLFIAGGLSWVAWWLTLKSFESS